MSDPRAGQDLAAARLFVRGQPLDEGVGGALAFFDQRGELGEVDALVLAALVEARPALETARGDLEDTLGDAQQRRAAELGGQGRLGDGRADGVELGERVVARELVGFVEGFGVVEQARPQRRERAEQARGKGIGAWTSIVRLRRTSGKSVLRCVSQSFCVGCSPSKPYFMKLRNDCPVFSTTRAPRLTRNIGASRAHSM